jgi:hypothetical protein
MVVGHVGLRGQGSPSAKLGTVAVVINRTAASTSRSFFTVFLLLKRKVSVVLCALPRAVGRERLALQVFGKSKLLELRGASEDFVG